MSRLLLEANPTWRAPSWGLALSTAGITIAVMYAIGGKTCMQRFLFPVAFFFIAIPWPTPLEEIVTQNLMRLNVAIVIELLNVFGVPALAHGNVIELSRGVVGVEEACSGIRSLQATLMIALFFGEFFRLRTLRRSGLLLGGIVFAMFFNVCRTYFLAWICSRYGNAAVELWHDRAGFFVLLCFIATWVLALKLRGKNPGTGSTGQAAEGNTESTTQKVENRGLGDDSGELRDGEPKTKDQGPGTQRNSAFSTPNRGPSFAIGLLPLVFFIFVVELSTHLWFWSHERHGLKSIQWSAHWPETAADFKTRTIPHATQTLLQCSRDFLAGWQDSDGRQWQGIYLRWDASSNLYGRARASLAKGHRPDACLPAMGLTLESELPPGETKVGDLPFRFHRYVFRTVDNQPFYVFFMVADDHSQALSDQALGLERSDRLHMALAGQRSSGQRSLEVAVNGFDSPDAAWSAFVFHLPQWIAETGGRK